MIKTSSIPEIVRLSEDMADDARQSIIASATQNELTSNPTTFSAHLDIFLEEAKHFMVLRLGENWKHSAQAIKGSELELVYRIELNLSEAIERLEHCEDEISARFRIC